jgi:hypothetical protein
MIFTHILFIIGHNYQETHNKCESKNYEEQEPVPSEETERRGTLRQTDRQTQLPVCYCCKCSLLVWMICVLEVPIPTTRVCYDRKQRRRSSECLKIIGEHTRIFPPISRSSFYHYYYHVPSLSGHMFSFSILLLPSATGSQNRGMRGIKQSGQWSQRRPTNDLSDKRIYSNWTPAVTIKTQIYDRHRLANCRTFKLFQYIIVCCRHGNRTRCFLKIVSFGLTAKQIWEFL